VDAREEIGLDELSSKVKRPLNQPEGRPLLRVYIVRPRERLGIDADTPRPLLDQLIAALGGTVIDYAGARKCCASRSSP